MGKKSEKYFVCTLCNNASFAQNHEPFTFKETDPDYGDKTETKAFMVMFLTEKRRGINQYDSIGFFVNWKKKSDQDSNFF